MKRNGDDVVSTPDDGVDFGKIVVYGISCYAPHYKPSIIQK